MQRSAIIVAGGAGSRLGGVDKPWLEVGGRPILEQVIEAVRPWADAVVVVGRLPAGAAAPRQVRWTLEDPPGSGPANAVRAGLAAVGDVDEVLLLAGDAPGLAGVLPLLCRDPLATDAVALESDGRLQYLTARVAAAPLRAALAAGGASMRSLFDHLRTQRLAAHVEDADTWEDVARIRAERWANMAKDAWLDEVSTLLAVDATIDIDAVLALTRDVAHNLERKNAPLTSYLLGYAAAAQGLSAAQVAELAERIGARARALGAPDA